MNLKTINFQKYTGTICGNYFWNGTILIMDIGANLTFYQGNILQDRK